MLLLGPIFPTMLRIPFEFRESSLWSAPSSAVPAYLGNCSCPGGMGQGDGVNVYKTHVHRETLARARYSYYEIMR